MIRLSSLSELAQLTRPIVLTVGFFDGVHLGHQALLGRLTQTAAEADALSLAIAFSNLPRAFHTEGLNPSYLTLPHEKLMLLDRQGLDAVLDVVYDDSIAAQTALEFFSDLKQRCDLRSVVLGYDTAIGRDMLRGEAAFRAFGTQLGIPVVTAEAFLKHGSTVKSSQARNLVLAGKMSAAAQILGRPYFILGEIRPGKGLGREQLGIPTANMYPPQQKLCPPRAIYAGRARLDGRVFPAAIAVMTQRQAHSTVLDRNRRAFDPGEELSAVIETHIVGFDGELYGREIWLEFLQLLRPWHDFSSVDDLRSGILADIERSRELAGITWEDA